MNQSRRRADHKKFQKLLEAVFTLCALEKALDESQLDSIVQRARIASRRRVAALRPNRRIFVDHDTLGHIIYRWERTPNYLNDEGNAFPIPARGPAPSIEALFRDIGKIQYFEQGLKHLREFNRVGKTKSGKYLPRAEITIVHTLTPELVEVISQTMNRLIDTLLHNTSRKSKSAVRLVERLTAVPDLPRRHVPAFKKFARDQGAALINTMNEWLESRRGTRKSRVYNSAENVTAGLHVFAFID